MRFKQNQWTAVALLGTFLLVTWFCYTQGFGATFQFDDEPNLNGLSKVADPASALPFVLGGHAGPTGRPIALASFLLNVGDWPVAPKGFLYINILIHLINGLLVAWTAYLLLSERRSDRNSAALLASATAGLWLLAPLLASSSLFIVQRMTTLAATFLFLGLIGYLKGRSLITSHPIRGYLTAGGALGIGTVLATFTKENGALLPLLVLVVEFTLLTEHKPVHRHFQKFVVAIVGLPALLVLGYLVSLLLNGIGGSTIRSFTLADRVATESIILWDYLRLLLIPNVAAYSPFHDDYQAVAAVLGWPVLLASMGWIIALFVAIRWRRRVPLFAFAVLWFLAGHIMESTWIMLELYFEHRNYVPAFGVFFALCAALVYIPRSYRRIAAISVGAYITIFALVLLQVTSLWSQPPLAAEIWYRRHPFSERATGYLAQRYVMWGNDRGALEVLDASAKRQHNIGLRLLALQVSCYTSSKLTPAERLPRLLRPAKTADFTHTASSALVDIRDLVFNGRCKLPVDDLIDLLDAFTSNSVYQRSSRMMFALYYLRANLYMHLRELDPTVRSLQKALSYKKDVNTFVLLAGVFASAGLYDDAAKVLLEAYRSAPFRPIKRYFWDQRIDRAQSSLAPYIAQGGNT